METKLSKELQEEIEKQSIEFTNFALTDILAMKKKTGVGWESEEALALIIDDTYKAGATKYALRLQEAEAKVAKLVEALCEADKVLYKLGNERESCRHNYQCCGSCGDIYEAEEASEKLRQALKEIEGAK